MTSFSMAKHVQNPAHTELPC